MVETTDWTVDAETTALSCTNSSTVASSTECVFRLSQLTSTLRQLNKTSGAFRENWMILIFPPAFVMQTVMTWQASAGSLGTNRLYYGKARSWAIFSPDGTITTSNTLKIGSMKPAHYRPVAGTAYDHLTQFQMLVVQAGKIIQRITFPPYQPLITLNTSTGLIATGISNMDPTSVPRDKDEHCWIKFPEYFL
jgi:hypothetical protein